MKAWKYLYWKCHVFLALIVDKHNKSKEINKIPCVIHQDEGWLIQDVYRF